MQKIALLAAVLLALPAAGQQGSRNNFSASLTGYQEVPSVNTVATGTFEARLDGNTVNYTLVYSGLQAPVQQAHIHFAQRSVNGSIIVWLCGTASLPGPAGTQTCPGTSGTVNGTFTSSNVLTGATATQQFNAGDFASLIDAMDAGIAYVNVHTAASPGGEIRGQIGRARDNRGR